MDNISRSPNSLNVQNEPTSRKFEPNELEIKKAQIKADIAFDRKISFSRNLAYSGTLVGYTVELSSFISKYIPDELVKSATERFKSIFLSPIDSAINTSMYFFKLSSSLTAVKKLNKVKKDFSDDITKNDKKCFRTLYEVQEQKDQLIKEIDNLQTDIVVQSYMLTQSPKKNVGSSVEELQKKLNDKKSELDELREYSLVLELQISNKNKVLANSLMLIHSLVTCAVSTTVATMSCVATVTLSPIFLVSSNVLLWSNKILHYSQITKSVFCYAESVYLNSVKVKRASIFHDNLEKRFKTSDLLSCAKLGKDVFVDPANPDDPNMKLLEKYWRLLNENKSSSSFPCNIRATLCDIGKTFITSAQVKDLEGFIDQMQIYYHTDETLSALLQNLNVRLEEYKERIRPIVISRLGERPVSIADINLLDDKIGMSKDMQKLLESITYRFITPEEVKTIHAYFKHVDEELENKKDLPTEYRRAIANLVSHYSNQCSNYSKEFFLSERHNLSDIIANNDIFSAYWLKLRFDHDDKTRAILHESWFSRMSKGNFNSVHSNKLIKFLDFFDEKFEARKSSKNDLLKIENWGKVWKLFHPFYTDDARERIRKDNNDLLLELFKNNANLKYLEDISLKRKIDWKNPSEVAEICEKYSKCDRMCDYVNAFVAGSSKMPRSKFFMTIKNSVENSKEVAKNKAVDIINSTL